MGRCAVTQCVGSADVPQTRSAPYFNDKRRVGSSPVRTIGASTHKGRLRGPRIEAMAGGVMLAGLSVMEVSGRTVGAVSRVAIALDSFADTERREGVKALLIIASRCFVMLA